MSEQKWRRLADGLRSALKSAQAKLAQSAAAGPLDPVLEVSVFLGVGGDGLFFCGAMLCVVPSSFIVPIHRASHNPAIAPKPQPPTNPQQARWENLAVAVARFERRVKALTASGSGGSGGDAAAMAFEFVEGLLVKAVREGMWVLLDEINLASAEVGGE